MSLKAKLEAVIYAAEEPVTLAQLAAIFADEARVYRAECEAAAAAEAAEAQASSGESLPLLDEGFAYLGLEQTPVNDAAMPSQTGEAAAPGGAAIDGSEPSGAGSAIPDPSPESQSAAQADVPLEGEPEIGARREARARDREVRDILKPLIDELIAGCACDDRGIEIREIAGGYRMATKPECHDAVRQFVRSLKPPLKLSLPALETLAVVAYKQPVTAPEVSEIRGVESAGTLGSLLSRKLIATAGRKPVVGRPILYKTTREFLLRFGLKDISELPSMEEFEKMAAIELDEQAGIEESTEAGEESEAEIELSDSFERTGEEEADDLEQPADSPVSAPTNPGPAPSGATQPAGVEAPRHES